MTFSWGVHHDDCGGPDVFGHPRFFPLSWEEVACDLLLARRFSDDVYVHSLEGCVRQRRS